MDCIHHLIKIITNHASLSKPLRPLLSKSNVNANNKLDLNDNHTIAFEQTKGKIKNIAENKNFGVNKQTRVECDASRKGLGT